MDKKELARRLLTSFKLDFYDDDGYIDDQRLDVLISLVSEYIDDQAESS